METQNNQLPSNNELKNNNKLHFLVFVIPLIFLSLVIFLFGKYANICFLNSFASSIPGCVNFQFPIYLAYFLLSLYAWIISSTLLKSSKHKNLKLIILFLVYLAISLEFFLYMSSLYY